MTEQVKPNQDVSFGLEQEVVKRLTMEPIKDGEDGYLFGGLTPGRLIDVKIEQTEHKVGEFTGKDLFFSSSISLTVWVKIILCSESIVEITEL